MNTEISIKGGTKLFGELNYGEAFYYGNLPEIPFMKIDYDEMNVVNLNDGTLLYFEDDERVNTFGSFKCVAEL